MQFHRGKEAANPAPEAVLFPRNYGAVPTQGKCKTVRNQGFDSFIIAQTFLGAPSYSPVLVPCSLLLIAPSNGAVPFPDLKW